MPDTAVLRACIRLIALLSRLAPYWRREEWRTEWLAELHFRSSRLAAHNRLTVAAQFRLLTRCSSASVHLVWLWRHEWTLDMVGQDVRYGLRMLRRRPGLSTTALLTLALGTGVTTSMFSAVNAVLLRPLPYPEPDRLIRMYGVDTRDGRAEIDNLSVPDMVDFERRAESFEALGAHNSGGYWTVIGQGDAERVPRLLVTSGYFRAFRAQAALGRLFNRDEDRPSPPNVVVISHGFWQRRFGGDPGVIGRTLVVSGTTVTIVGVLRPGFVHPDPAAEAAPDIFALLDPDPKMSGRGARYVHAIGRLRQDRTIDQALSELRAIAAFLERQYPQQNTGRTVLMRSLHEAVAGLGQRPLLVLQCAALMVLLIGCVNLAHLLLGAAIGRDTELRIRTMLGAGRPRIVRQLLTESLVLAAGGGALGLVLAWSATRYLANALEPVLLPDQRIAIDGTVLGFALSASAAAALMFGMVPALCVSRPAVGCRDPHRHTDRPQRTRVRSMLIVGEVALSVTLLIGAVLLIRSLYQLTRVDPGFRTEGVLSFRLAVPASRYPEGTQAAFYDRIYERLRALPGVKAAGGIDILPLSGGYSCDGFQIDGRVVPAAQQRCAEARSVSTDYFRVMGIRLLRGRLFTDGDHARARRVVIVNEAFGRTFLPGEDPVGRSLVYNSRGQNDARPIVGVVADVYHFGPRTAAAPEYYLPQSQPPSYHAMNVVVQFESDPDALVPILRDEVRELTPDAPIHDIRTMDDLFERSVGAERQRTVLLTVFAALAVLLAVMGTYGVISFVVAQRTQEIGVRLALGAAPNEIVRLVAGRGLRLVAGGTALGLAGGVVMSRALAALVFNVSPGDPVTFVAAASIAWTAGVIATCVPALRGSRLNPVTALTCQ